MLISHDLDHVVQVHIKVNGEPVDLRMKLGPLGEAFFVSPVDESDADVRCDTLHLHCLYRLMCRQGDVEEYSSGTAPSPPPTATEQAEFAFDSKHSSPPIPASPSRVRMLMSFE